MRPLAPSVTCGDTSPALCGAGEELDAHCSSPEGNTSGEVSAKLTEGAYRIPQNVVFTSTPQVRGSLMKPVRLSKSIAPSREMWLVMLRPKTAASHLPPAAR